MLKNQPPAKRGFPLPGLNLPRPIKITIGAIAAIILLVVVISIFSGRGSGTAAAFASVLARGQETLRVTQDAQQLQLQDPSTQALAATVTNSLTSDQVQFKNYLSRNHISVSSGEVASDTDKSTDSSLQSALQNNSLDTAYASYIQGALTKYENDLRNAYNLAGPHGKQLLNNAYDSAQTLLTSPPIKA